MRDEAAKTLSVLHPELATDLHHDSTKEDLSHLVAPSVPVEVEDVISDAVVENIAYDRVAVYHLGKEKTGCEYCPILLGIRDDLLCYLNLVRGAVKLWLSFFALETDGNLVLDVFLYFSEFDPMRIALLHAWTAGCAGVSDGRPADVGEDMGSHLRCPRAYLSAGVESITDVG